MDQVLHWFLLAECAPRTHNIRAEAECINIVARIAYPPQSHVRAACKYTLEFVQPSCREEGVRPITNVKYSKRFFYGKR
jgi:hypothetical protein